MATISKEDEERLRDFSDKVDDLMREYLLILPANAILACLLSLGACLAMSAGHRIHAFVLHANEAYKEMERQGKEN